MLVFMSVRDDDRVRDISLCKFQLSAKPTNIFLSGLVLSRLDKYIDVQLFWKSYSEWSNDH